MLYLYALKQLGVLFRPLALTLFYLYFTRKILR
jgi:hypothetical protein